MANQPSSLVIWLTGLPCSGKTTLARALEKALSGKGYFTCVLDGDEIRSGLNKDLGFSPADRTENIRRIAEVARILIKSGIITIAAFITPTREMRKMAREIIGEEDFFEVYISTPIETCEQRDKKGLYDKARRGMIKEFTGVSATYEEPLKPDLEIDTIVKTVEESVEELMPMVMERVSKKYDPQIHTNEEHK